MTNVPSVEELLKEVPHGSPTWAFVIDEIEKRPKKYEVFYIQADRKTLYLGTDDIPREGKIVGCTDNEWYEMQSGIFKKRFPELQSSEEIGNAVVIERVVSVRRCTTGSTVEVTINRYLIKEKKRMPAAKVKS